jgi:hypothetical protein
MTLASTEVAKSLRMVLSALASVAPMSFRRSSMAFSFSSTITMDGPELMKSVRLEKNGLDLWTA